MKILQPTSVLSAGLLFGSSAAFQTPRLSDYSRSHTHLSSDYLTSLAGSAPVQQVSTPAPRTPTPPAIPAYAPPTPSTSLASQFTHAPLNYFDIPNLKPKGARANADVGQPHDATLKLGGDGSIRAGSWWCAAGGWPSLKERATTEIFFVIEGQGCLTDLDGERHYFGPGDTVVLPKGWSGRWDVLADIHKIWFVHDHPQIEERSKPIRARIENYHKTAPQHLQSKGVRADAIHGAPSTASSSMYNVGPTEVGVWTCTAGSFPVVNRPTTECFFVLEGVFFLTNADDGSARRCGAGDTVILPKGWSGYWDVIEPVKKLWVNV